MFSFRKSIVELCRFEEICIELFRYEMSIMSSIALQRIALICLVLGEYSKAGQLNTDLLKAKQIKLNSSTYTTYNKHLNTKQVNNNLHKANTLNLNNTILNSQTRQLNTILLKAIRTIIQWNLYKWGSMGRAKLELAPFPGYNLYYEVLIYYLIASLFGVLIN